MITVWLRVAGIPHDMRQTCATVDDARAYLAAMIRDGYIASDNARYEIEGALIVDAAYQYDAYRA